MIRVALGPSVRHPLRGFLIGPLVVPLAYWLGGMVYVGLRPDLRLDGAQALRELMLILAFGLPIAYLATLVWGVPALYLLRRLGWMRAWTVIVAGASAGTIASMASRKSSRLVRLQKRSNLAPWSAAIASVCCFISTPCAIALPSMQQAPGQGT